jgi:hypothetical protein
MSEFEVKIQDGASILTDGGIETRIMFETDVPLPPHVQGGRVGQRPDRRTGTASDLRELRCCRPLFRPAGDHRHPDLPGEP